MRAKASPEEIEAVITALQRLWLRVPEQRLGQLLLNLSTMQMGGDDINLLWNMDEDAILEAVRKWPCRHPVQLETCPPVCADCRKILR